MIPTGEKTAMAKVFYEETVNGETIVRNYTTGLNALPFALPVRPGVGKQFWAWPAVTDSFHVIACDFTDAPIVSATPSVNLATYNSITVLPEDVLMWSTPVEE